MKTRVFAFIIVCLSVCSARAQVAAFLPTPGSGCAPLPVIFQDQSTGNPTSWLWDFGDGTTSTQQNVNPHIYFNPGTYTVTLTVSGGNKTSAVVTVYATPTANFSADKTTGCFPLGVNFTDNSTSGGAAITNWSWDFGDGDTSKLQNPSHVYTGASNFPVTLKVTNANGCNAVVTQTGYIQITEGVSADFTTNAAAACKVPIAVNFTNNTTGPPTLSYQWSFGDGGTSAQVNPQYTYTAGGTFNVSLTATSTAGCTAVVTKPIQVAAGNIHSSFTAPDSLCVGSPTDFLNTSTPAPAFASWDFGDNTTSTVISPSKTYAAVGTYQVKLVNTFGACVDSVTKQVVVVAPPVADFSANNTNCNSPRTVSFQDLSPSATAWQWNFGDNSLSNVQNPVHVYAVPGNFHVILTITTKSGCTSTVNKTVPVHTAVANITNLPAYGCAPYNFTPVLVDTTVDGVASYAWDFGDGTTSTLQNPPAHLYATSGIYPVKITITTNSGCTGSYTDTVKVGTTKPVPAFTATPLIQCVNTPVQFTDQSTNGADQWLWNFGDGTTSTSKNPTHAYLIPNTYSVQLKVYNAGCGDSLTKVKLITVSPPLAGFAYTVSCSANQLLYSFHDSSTGANTWLWDFGDGSPTSNLQNPTHIYPSVDNSFKVALTVKNNVSGCFSTDTQNVVISNQNADFITNASSICKNTQVTISVAIANYGDVANYIYDFGDGTVKTQTGANLAHTYTKAGVYDVTVTINEKNGCTAVVLKKGFITVNGPVAGFAASPLSGCNSVTATFTDQSVSDGRNNITTWLWDFGDGAVQSFSAPPFTHTYTQQGIYTVKMKITDAFGCTDSLSQANIVSVGVPKASFTTVDSLSCPGSPIQFINNSSGYGLSYAWDFGDGNTSTALTPVPHLYPIGIYTVSLKVTDQFGCISTVAGYNIKVDKPVATFTVDNTTASCPPLKSNFTFTGQYYQSLKWFFGDGGTSSLLNPTHFYTIPGIYYDTLVVTSHGGCTDTAAVVKIQVFGPYGALSYSPILGCHTLTVNFSVVTNNVIKYVWDFNNGQTQTTVIPSTVFTYDAPGKYTPVVILQDAAGCNVPVFGSDTVLVVGSQPDFGTDKQLLCQSGTIQFSDSSKSIGTISVYHWDFGDGSISTDQNPSHFYAAPGLYSVKLVVTAQGGCQDSITHINLIKVVATPVIDISGSISQCAPAGLDFHGVVLVPDTSALKWAWNFYTGQVSTVQDPPKQVYPTAGADSVQLVVTNSSGCMDTALQYFTVYPLPLTNAGIDTVICLGGNVTLTATGAATYNWLPPNNTLSCTTNCASPVATPATKTAYVVSGVSSFGCIQTDTVIVNVVTPQTVSVSPTADSICVGQTTVLTASGEDLYQWSPAAGLSNPSIANPIAGPDTTTLYRVVGSDSRSCFTDTEYVKVSVFDYPTINVGPDATILAGYSYQITGISSPDVVSINWTPVLGLTCADCLSPVATPTSTTAYTIRVVNNGGCPASDTIKIIVTCNNNNLFVPNTFSPNNDGMNDVFYVRGKGLTNIESMQIFNRWGQIVFEKRNFAPNDPAAGWDGTVNGKKAPGDVYIYTISVICENNVIVPYHGNVALIR